MIIEDSNLINIRFKLQVLQMRVIVKTLGNNCGNKQYSFERIIAIKVHSQL